LLRILTKSLDPCGSAFLQAKAHRMSTGGPGGVDSDWIPEHERDEGILRGILRIPNHWAPNQQFAIIVEVTSKVVYLEISEHTVDENTSC